MWNLRLLCVHLTGICNLGVESSGCGGCALGGFVWLV